MVFVRKNTDLQKNRIRLFPLFIASISFFLIFKSPLMDFEFFVRRNRMISF